MDQLGPGRAAGEVAAGRNLDAAADLPGRVQSPDVEVGAAGDQNLDAAADPADHRSQGGKGDGTRGISFPWGHNIP